MTGIGRRMVCGALSMRTKGKSDRQAHGRAFRANRKDQIDVDPSDEQSSNAKLLVLFTAVSRAPTFDPYEYGRPLCEAPTDKPNQKTLAIKQSSMRRIVRAAITQWTGAICLALPM